MRSAQASVLSVLCCLLALAALPDTVFAVDANLIGVPIKLKSAYTKFKDSAKQDKSAPAGMRFLIVDEINVAGAPSELSLQPLGTIPEHTLPSGSLIDKNARYTVTATDFKAYWAIDFEGAAKAGASSLVNLQGSQLKMKADFDALVGPDGSREAVTKDQRLRVRKDDGESLSLTVVDSSECRQRTTEAPGSPRKKISGTCAQVGPLYQVKKAEFGPEYWDRTGWAYGPLFAPFKMRFKDKSITGEASLGGYMGYEFRPFGISMTPAVHAGLSVVTVGGDNTSAQNVNDTTSKPAFTWGLALILKPGENYQAGIILGKDRIGGTDGASWQYEGKWWLSVAIGYNFAR